MQEQEIVRQTLCLGDRASWTPWIMGGAAALMVLVGIFIFLAYRRPFP